MTMTEVEQLIFLDKYQGRVFTNRGGKYAVLCGLILQGRFCLMTWDREAQEKYPDEVGLEGWVMPSTIREGRIWKEVKNV